MKYTIDDLRGKYVKVGTPECEIFLDVCDMLGVRWANGASARNKHQDKECIALNHHSETLSFSEFHYYQNINCWDLFVPKTDITTDDVDNTVTQRGERYGLFADGAVIMQDLKAVMRATPGWERLTPSQREALEMIQHKIGRVLNGDPMYDDSWRDISGYSTLILNELNGVKR